MNIFKEIENHPSFLSSFEEIDFENIHNQFPIGISIDLDGREIDCETIDRFVNELDKSNVPYKLRVIWEKEY